VEETTAIFGLMAEAEEIELETKVRAGITAVSVDSARIRQVLVNLLANAMRYTPQNGRITIRVEPITTGVEIMVQDNGEGIASEHLPYVFDRFYRADPARSRDSGGTGLGLAIARAIIEAHGGQITVQSDGPGQGSTFTFCLLTARDSKQ
jgi:signal transduction histidine kinase